MKKIILYLIVIIVTIAILAFLIYLLWPLRLEAISPTNNSKENPIDTTVDLAFNKKLWLNKFSLIANPTLPAYSTHKDGAKLTFTFKDNLKTNTTYQILLNSNKLFTFNDQKNNSLAWEFTTGSGIADEMFDMNFGDFFDKNPLARFTPFENDHFSIKWPNEQGVTTIILYAIFNAGVNGPPIEEQEKAYKEQLKSYKQEALDWIKSKGIDPQTLKINWLPEEANQLP